METVYWQNGIIIKDSTSRRRMPTDTRKALEDALEDLKENHHSGLQVVGWDWTSLTLPMSCPDEIRTAKCPELLRVVNGAGLIISDDLGNEVDYGHWAFIPKGISYALRGTVVSGMNFRVAILALK